MNSGSAGRAAANVSRWASGTSEHPTVPLRTVAFHALRLDDAVAAVGAMVEAGTPRYVVTANVDCMVQCARDPELSQIVKNARLVLADGMPLVWAARWRGTPLPERVAGADLVPKLLALAEARGYRVFWLGGTERVARAMTARVAALYPRLLPIETYAPPIAPLEAMDHAEIQRRIRRARPHVLLVSFGCPKQEKWIARHARDLQVPVCIGVGASIDFLSGRISRAPLWMRAAGLEWLYRFFREPRRLGPRYASDIRWVVGWCLTRRPTGAPKASGMASATAWMSRPQ
jgi:N-acetylglucosaminyldiphosphoundecaprenol N-acetyl-beta-D-mannosaminyltransferase